MKKSFLSPLAQGSIQFLKTPALVFGGCIAQLAVHKVFKAPKFLAYHLSLLFLLAATQTSFAQEGSCNCTLEVGSGVGKPNLSTSGILLPKTGGCIKVVGNFLLDVNLPPGIAHFTGVDFQMMPGAEIFVSLGRNIIINTSTLHGCTNMWKGITLKSKPGFSSSSLSMTQCTIRDAQYAITLPDEARLNLVENNFDKNWTGLKCIDYSGFFDPFFGCGGTMPSLCGNTFQGTGGLLPAYSGQTPTPGTQAFYGIHLQKCSNLTIGGSTLETNFFKSLKKAIYVERCMNTSIRTCEIEGYLPPYLFFDGSIGIEIFDSRDNQLDFNSFLYLEAGIRVANSRGGLRVEMNGPFEVAGSAITVNNFSIQPNSYGDPTDMRIKDNFDVVSYFGKCIQVTHLHGAGTVAIVNNSVQVGAGFNGYYPTYGILFNDYNSSSGEVFINLNNVTMGASNSLTGGILISNNPSKTLVLKNEIDGSSGYTGFGILAANTVKCQIVDNTVDGNTYSGGYSIREAFRVDMSENSILCCNKPNESTYGVSYLGPNSSDLANTEFKSHLNRLSLFQATTGVQINTGNDWTFNDPGKQWDAIYEGSITDIDDSQFLVESALMPDGHNNIEVVGGTTTDKQNWFKFQGDDPACAYQLTPSSSILCGFEGYAIQEDIESKDLWATEGSSEPQNYTMVWEAQRQLYDKLLRNPSLVSHSTPISDFFTNASNGTIGQYHDFSHLLEDLYIVPGSMASSFNSTFNNYVEANATLLTLQKAMDSVSISSPYHEGLSEEYQASFSDMETLSSQILLYDSLLSIEYTNRITGLLTANQNLPGNEICHANERAINDVLLQVYLNNHWIFDTITRQVIDGVAGQCPLTGGRAVYTARSLQSLYRQPDWSQDHCMIVGERSESTSNLSASQFLVHLFPVPANDAINVEFDQPLSETTRLRLIDMRGQILHTASLVAGADRYSIDLARFNPGVYFVEFQNPFFGISVKRFLVIR